MLFQFILKPRNHTKTTNDHLLVMAWKCEVVIRQNIKSQLYDVASFGRTLFYASLRNLTIFPPLEVLFVHWNWRIKHYIIFNSNPLMIPGLLPSYLFALFYLHNGIVSEYFPQVFHSLSFKSIYITKGCFHKLPVESIQKKGYSSQSK